MTIDINLLKIPEPTTINEYRVTKKISICFRCKWNFCFETLSRARKVIENTFGILASRFRIFRGSIIGETRKIKNITKATVILHDFLMRKGTRNMCFPPDYVDQETSQGLSPGRVPHICLMKLIEANSTYINTYVLYPTTLDDLFYFW